MSSKKCIYCATQVVIKEKVVGDKCFECDHCKRIVCEECSGETFTASEVRVLQQKKSRSLKFFCEDCLDELSSSQNVELGEEIKKTIKEVVTSVDAGGSVNKSVSEIKITLEEIQEMNNKIKNLIEEVKQVKVQVVEKPVLKPSYSDKLKSSYETLVIQPKEGTILTANQTRDKLKDNVNPVDLKIGIAHIKNVLKGGVAISCGSKQEIDKLKEEVQNKLGEDFMIHAVQKKKPRLKIVGIDECLPEEEIKNCIYSQNSCVNKDVAEIKVVVIKKMKTKYMAIIEVDKNTFNSILEKGKLKLGWSVCAVFESVNILRCFKCMGYGHKAENCTNNTTCSKCGDQGHKMEECVSDLVKCVNCTITNEKFGLKLDYNHTAVNYMCPVYKRQIERRKERIDYKI